MAGVNKVILVGNLGKDPEVRHFDGGTSMAKFPLATSETIRDKAGNRTETTEWHNVVLWRGLAEVAEKYLKKGNTVYIEGKIRTRNYEDKDGIKRYSTEIVGDNLVMLGSKNRDQEGSSNQGSSQDNRFGGQDSYASKSQSSQPDPMDTGFSQGGDDDLPF